MESNSNNQEANLAVIETHLQVSNVVQILFNINPNILGALVEQTPEEARNNPHYTVLCATYEYYKAVYAATQKKKEESNIIPSTILPAGA
jgi:hypothetical protein